MLSMLSRYRDHDGFSLVELLVVMVLLGIVGAIAATGISRGLQADREAQSRIEAFEDIQIAVERVSRDVRAATTLIDIEPRDIRFEVVRDGSCVEHRYWVDENGDLRAADVQFTDDCETPSGSGERILVPAIEPGSTVFIYETDEYLEDADGNRQRTSTEAVGDVRFVTITMTRSLVDQRPVTVRTVVGLRNAR